MSINNVKSKLPSDFINMLEEVYTQSERDSIYKSFDRGRYTSFRINPIKGQVSTVIKEIKSIRINPIDIYELPNAFYIKGQEENKIKRLSCYKNGEIYLQSQSSMIPPCLIPKENNLVILDLCAAPGGKSLYTASILNEECEIIANEPNEIRRGILKYNIEKQGTSCIKVTGYDGRNISNHIDRKFDYIIVDAPCSGEGILKLSKSSANYIWNMKRIKRFTKIQRQLLKNASKLLKPNGIIIYSTCTLNPFENENVICDFIQEENFKLLDIEHSFNTFKNGIESYENNKFTNELSKAIRIVPSEFMEGFFIAKLQRK